MRDVISSHAPQLCGYAFTLMMSHLIASSSFFSFERTMPYLKYSVQLLEIPHVLLTGIPATLVTPQFLLTRSFWAQSSVAKML
jgi:hypothetical protein